jgi:hypothetical protein
MAQESISSVELTQLLLEGKLTHKWTLGAQEIVYDLFPVGTSEQISVRASGLDQASRKLVTDIFDLANALRSVGKYDFESSAEEKLKFVRGLFPPVFKVFIDELRLAERNQLDLWEKRLEELKKVSMNHS